MHINWPEQYEQLYGSIYVVLLLSGTSKGYPFILLVIGHAMSRFVF